MDSDTAQPRLDRAIALRVFFFAAVLFFLELCFFRLLGYLTHYLESMLIIAYALAGVALGGLLAARLKTLETTCYLQCLLGTYVCLAGSLLKVLRYPSLGPDNLALVGMFAFPAFYIASAFRRYPSGQVYFYDLAGAGAAVLLLFVSHQVSYLEMILLVTSWVLALLGALGASRAANKRGTWVALFSSLCLLSSLGIAYEAKTGNLNIYYLAAPSPLSEWKDFHKGRTLFRFYDNLVSRVEVYNDETPGPRFSYISSGMMQDGFRPDYPPRFRRDARLIGGFFKEPLMFIIGSSAEGVLKTARYMTRPEKIHGSEVNPAVLTIMTEDFVKESGYAFMGLQQRLGNALAILNRSEQRYDIITLMNPHSSGQMFLQGPPDWLHTQESYELYLRCLSEEGYLMVEERPMQKPGFEILLKRLATIYKALAKGGAKNPADHFFIYSWHWDRYQPYQDFTDKVFTSIFIKKKPLTEQDKIRLLDWLRVTGPRWSVEGKIHTEATEAEIEASAVRFDYLPGIVETPPYQNFFAHLAQNSLQAAYPQWDLEPVTDDRPFSAAVDRQHRDVKKVFLSVGWLTLLLALPVLWSFRKSRDRLFHARMHSYQLLAGAAYILVEVFLMQLYQKVILSPNVAFVGILSVLLISSGIGGHLLYKQRKVFLIYFGFALSISLHLGLSHLLISQGVDSDLATAFLIILATAFSGLMMGAFLPLGLQRAKEAGHESFVADYFATNSLGGTLALAASLYLPIVYGFRATAMVAASLYLLVTLAAASFRPRS